MAVVYLGEDTPTQALFVRGILARDPDLEVTVFEDGLELYLAVQQNPPDLIISDIVLPTVDGVAIARLLKYHESYQQVPFLLVSSMTAEEVGGLQQIGADAFLPKPLKAASLREMVSRLLGARA
ncbi:MAG: response regulator [Candidatus Eremiobacteraeota bacterium]|nr:response regulator [Candidatus Eremiobacteraeota bacterium]